jgi:hypothetical protein
MKRTTIIGLLLLAFAMGAFADHPATTGVGIVAAAGYGGAGYGNQVGVSLKLRTMPIFWALHLSLDSSSLSLGVTGDEYLRDEGLLREKGFKLDWFLGLGGYANLRLSSSPAAAFGARLPVGLSCHLSQDFELWLDLAPSLGLQLNPVAFPDWSLPAELGLRAWLR